MILAPNIEVMSGSSNHGRMTAKWHAERDYVDSSRSNRSLLREILPRNIQNILVLDRVEPPPIATDSVRETSRLGVHPLPETVRSAIVVLSTRSPRRSVSTLPPFDTPIVLPFAGRSLRSIGDRRRDPSPSPRTPAPIHGDPSHDPRPSLPPVTRQPPSTPPLLSAVCHPSIAPRRNETSLAPPGEVARSFRCPGYPEAQSTSNHSTGRHRGNRSGQRCARPDSNRMPIDLPSGARDRIRTGPRNARSLRSLRVPRRVQILVSHSPLTKMFAENARDRIRTGGPLRDSVLSAAPFPGLATRARLRVSRFGPRT